MFGYACATLLLTLCLSLQENTADQTDWSDGPGEPGPLLQWSNSFSESEFINWTDQEGAVFLQTDCDEKLIAGDYGNASFLACCDFNDDGYIDVACTSYGDDQLAWYENMDGGCTWTEHLIESYLPLACVLSTGDIDKDGIPDLMCASEGGDGICWWRNNNWAESWTKIEVDTSCNYPFSVEPADFDRDGDMDICAALYGQGDIVWYSNDDSIGTQWTKHIIEGAFPSAWWAVPGDFNGDGIEDVAGARHGGEINWWENDGNGEFTTTHSITTDYLQCTTIRNCDLNGDMCPDVAACSNAGEIAWWENSSQGDVWVEHVIDDNLEGSWSLWAEDLDNDGDQDVIGNDREGDCVYWYENIDGSGTLWMRWTLDQGMDMSNDVNAADLDNDGFPDPIATFGGDNTIYWWKLSQEFNPMGTLASSILYMGEDAQWGIIHWESDEPSGTDIQVWVKAGDTIDSMGDWVEIPESGVDLSAYIPDNTRYLQYSLSLTSSTGLESPSFNYISFDWIPMGLPENRRDEIHLGLPSPNPANCFLSIPIESGNTSQTELRVFDVAGRCVSYRLVPENENSFCIDCSRLPAGTYVARLCGGKHFDSAGFSVLR